MPTIGRLRQRVKEVKRRADAEDEALDADAFNDPREDLAEIFEGIAARREAAGDVPEPVPCPFTPEQIVSQIEAQCAEHVQSIDPFYRARFEAHCRAVERRRLRTQG